MLVKISNTTLELIKNDAIPALNIKSKINEDDCDNIYIFFCDKEVYLSQNLNDGIYVNEDYLDKICKAIDEMNVLDDDDVIDLVDLNNRL